MRLKERSVVNEITRREVKKNFLSNRTPDICGNLSGIFSGLLAFGFDHLSGAGGLSGWQW